MLLRRGLAVLVLLLLAPLPSSAAETQPPPVEVIDISGPLDERAVDFMIDAIRDSDAQAVILQLNSPAALTGDIEDLIELVRDPPVPVAAWVGPAPARAYGGAAHLLSAVSFRAAAPETKIGYLHPVVAGSGETSRADTIGRLPDLPEQLVDDRIEIAGPIPGIVDHVIPSIGQVVVALDGVNFTIAGTDRAIDTAEEITGSDGVARLQPVVQVRFTKGDLLSRVLRLAVRPEAAFFFLVAGLSLAAFEFYAAGVGVMAAVATLSLFLAGYGIGALPVRWWAVSIAVLGIGLYTSDVQRNDIGLRSLLGTGLLLGGGLWFVEGAPQLVPVWWAVVLVVVGAALFFGIGMTVVVRSRFSTRTIGREHLVGRRGVAETGFDPDGVVSVDGARWRASASRAAGIEPGTEVQVTGVSGIVLVVEPSGTARG